MKTVNQVAAIGLMMTFVSCGCVERRSYSGEDIAIIKVERTVDAIVIKYRVKAESYYYNPGITVSMDGDRADILFVRSSIKERGVPKDCIMAEALRGTDINQVSIPRVPGSVFIVAGNGRRQLVDESRWYKGDRPP